MKFEEIQPDVMATQVTKYAKMVYQFEKGLPPNEVVPALKFKVEAMKDKVSLKILVTYVYIINCTSPC